MYLTLLQYQSKRRCWKRISKQSLRRDELLTIFQIPTHLLAEEITAKTARRKISLEKESKDAIKLEDSCGDTGISTVIQRPEEEISSRVPNVIMTPGLFPLMELPTELRLKVPYPCPISN